MQITGSCHCGKIHYQADVDPAAASICHCTDCQQLSGSPWRASVPAEQGSFQIEGEPTVYVKTADSGRKRGQAFCAACGSPIYSFSPGEPGPVNIRLGTVDQRADLPPRKRIWCDSALPWSQHIDELPGTPRE